MESNIKNPISSILPRLAKTLPINRRSTAISLLNLVQIDSVDRDCRELWPVTFWVIGAETDTAWPSRQTISCLRYSRWFTIIEMYKRLEDFYSGLYTPTDAVSIKTVKQSLTLTRYF